MWNTCPSTTPIVSTSPFHTSTSEWASYLLLKGERSKSNNEHLHCIFKDLKVFWCLNTIKVLLARHLYIHKSTHLNELVVCHVSTVKRLLVIHKSWQFSLLNLLATQHQNSRGKDTLYNRFCTWRGSCTDNTHRVCPTKDRTNMSSVSLPASERSGHKPWREYERGG